MPTRKKNRPTFRKVYKTFFDFKIAFDQGSDRLMGWKWFGYTGSDELGRYDSGSKRLRYDDGGLRDKYEIVKL